MPPQQTVRRQRQSARRLEDILDAAALLFAERGFHRTTTRDIAEAADVAEGTLYNYFTNKNDLLFGILNRLKLEGTLEEEVLHMPVESDASRSSLMSILLGRRGFLEKNRVMLQAILSEMLANEELRRRYSDEILAPVLTAVQMDLTHHSELGQIRPIDTQAAARLLIAFWYGVFILQILGDPLVTGDWERLTKVFGDLLFDGLSA